MRYLDLTLSTPEENLSCDEVLLELAEQGGNYQLLRFWEPSNYFVVLGRGNKVHPEVNTEYCKENQIPILRRCSGGGTVFQGPGCLNYSLILKIQSNPELKTITQTNQYIMNQHKQALVSILDKEIQVQGITDLVIQDSAVSGMKRRGIPYSTYLKFSGNAQKRKRKYLLFHGTFLLNFDIPLIDKILSIPQKQPDYRQNRRHKDFLMNLNLPSDRIKEVILKTWNVKSLFKGIPYFQINDLVQSRYSKEEWNLRF